MDVNQTNKEISFGQPFNPVKFFSEKKFISFLNHLPDEKLMLVDKKIMKQLSLSCAGDGLSLTNQKKLATETGYCVDYVGRRLRLLVKRGFLECIEAPLLDRRRFKHSNSYYFLWHSVYEKSMLGQVCLRNKVQPNVNQEYTHKMKIEVRFRDFVEGADGPTLIASFFHGKGTSRKLAIRDAVINARIFIADELHLKNDNSIEIVISSDKCS